MSPAGLVANTAAKDRQHRADLGEAAIRLLAALGIPLAQLEELIEIDDSAEMIAKLEELRS